MPKNQKPGRLVATLGLRDLVIVETKEALLILPRDRAQEVRKILERPRKLS
jgi:mannose-1-phosphate guanylyltransferase